MRDRDQEWAELMRASIGGDGAAYRRLLLALAPVLRAFVRRGLARSGIGSVDAEDVVQETLLAIHLKRQSWDQAAPITPWIVAIARHKLVDHLRRRGRRAEVALEDFSELLSAAPEEPAAARDIERAVAGLDGRPGEVVRAVSLHGASIRETAARLGMSEGAVRIALHRGLAALAARYRSKE